MSTLRKAPTTFLSIFSSIAVSLLLIGCNSSSGGSADSDTIDVAASSAVTSTAPIGGSTDIATNVKVVTVFAEPMNADTLNQNSYTLRAVGESAIVGAVNYNASTQTATLTPNGNLTANTLYTATLSTAIENEAGTSLSNTVAWTFTTGDSTDTDAPTVKSNNPENGETGVVLNTTVNVVFSEAIDPGTLTDSSFELRKDGGDAVSGSYRYANANTVVFTPTVNLEEMADYTVTLTSDLTDLAGNSLTEVAIGFQTGSDISQGPEPVKLGTAGNYVILAKTGISTTGTTNITGDIAVSPESRTALTGFDETLVGTFATSGLVTGELFAADMDSPTPSQLTTAVSNMETAYTDAAGRPDPDQTELGEGEIGGRTLEPGLYKWGTGVKVSSDVTLEGSENDVWIFQIDQDLKLEDSTSIILEGGAKPENIFWQVAGEVTLQAGATFNGIIISQTAIVLKSGAVINGRALAQTAVTLISNTVTEPAQ